MNISVFERNDYVGGRSTTVNAYDDPSQPVELGASIFVSVNRNLVSACNAFNLSTSTAAARRGEDDEKEVLGVWDGTNFVFTQSLGVGRWESWWSTTKLLWRYGLAPLRTVRLMKSVVGRFLQLYDEPYFPFYSLSQVAYDVGLSAVTAATGAEYVNENDVGDLFAREIIQASTRVNYAQNLANIHGLEAMVCMATDGAMAVEGGNWQIFQGMLTAAQAALHLDTEVSSIHRKKDGTYDVSFRKDKDTADLLFSTTFDSIILAAPFQSADIEVHPPLSIIPEKINYVTLHVLLFASPYRLAPGFFGLAPAATVPAIILTTIPEDEDPGKRDGTPQQGSPGFYSISNLGRASNPKSPDKQEFLYKIFSAQNIDQDFLLRLLDAQDGRHEDAVTWTYRKTWQSYPYLPPRTVYDELRLDDAVGTDKGGFWYTSGIESFISTMETSSLSGMNVARIVVDKIIEEGSSEWVVVQA